MLPPFLPAFRHVGQAQSTLGSSCEKVGLNPTAADYGLNSDSLLEPVYSLGESTGKHKRHENYFSNKYFLFLGKMPHKDEILFDTKRAEIWQLQAKLQRALASLYTE